MSTIQKIVTTHSLPTSAGTPTFQSPRSVEEPQNGIQSREYTEATSSRPEELQNGSRHGTTAQGLEEWGQRESEVVVEVGGVVMQKQELAAQKEDQYQ
jgi:hypothetical protein